MMIRDFLSGAFWGTTVAALGMVAASQLTPLPVERISAEASAIPRVDAAAVPNAEPEPVAPPQTATSAEPAPATVSAAKPNVAAAIVAEEKPAAEPIPDVKPAPVVQALPAAKPAEAAPGLDAKPQSPATDAAVVTPPLAESATAAKPVAKDKPMTAPAATALVDAKPAAPVQDPVATEAQTLEPATGSEGLKPVPDNAPALAPAISGADAAPIQKEAAAPTVVATADDAAKEGEAAVAPKIALQVPKPLVAPEPTETAEAPALAPATADKTQIALAQPDQPTLPAADEAPSAAVAQPAPAAKPAVASPLEPPVLPKQQPTPAPEALPQILPVPDTLPQPEPLPVGTADPQLQPSAKLKPAPALKGSVDGVRVGRLPSIGAPTAPAEGDAAQTAPAVFPDGTPGLVLEDNTDLPPLQKYARAFDNPTNKPLFSIILIDTGGADLDRAALAALPFAVTFALDPLAPNVAEAAKIYRDAGQEVIMVATGIPAGATASDLEVTFQAHATALPEAVAVIDTEFGAFQSNRPLATQVVPILKAQGRGLISWDRGLNAADQVARRDGLAAGMVFRKLDGKGENKSAVRRALDRAAFKAAQDGHVLVIGQTLPETVAAITEWAGESKAEAVALAPVSAALTVQ